MKRFIIWMMVLLVVFLLWQIFSGFSKRLLSKDLNRIKKSGLKINRSWFHRLEKLLMMLTAGLVYFLQFKLIWLIHWTIFPADRFYSLDNFMNETDRLRLLMGFLLVVPGMFSSICLSGVILNCVEWAIPSLARRAEADSGATFQEAMPAVIGITLLVVPICLFFQLLGAVLF